MAKRGVIRNSSRRSYGKDNSWIKLLISVVVILLLVLIILKLFFPDTLPQFSPGVVSISVVGKTTTVGPLNAVRVQCPNPRLVMKNDSGAAIFTFDFDKYLDTTQTVTHGASLGNLGGFFDSTQNLDFSLVNNCNLSYGGIDLYVYNVIVNGKSYTINQNLVHASDTGQNTTSTGFIVPYNCGGVSCPTATPICGNRIVETGEQCDDGNTVNGDGCSSSCQRESNSTCTDSDGGLNYNVKGTTNYLNGSSFTDQCLGGWLREYYCQNWVDYRCPYGYSCGNGACIVNATQHIVDPVCAGAYSLKQTNNAAYLTEGQKVYHMQYVAIPNKLLRLTQISNFSGNYPDDQVKFTDTAGFTYDAMITGEGRGAINFDGLSYAVNYAGPSTNADLVAVWLDYPQTLPFQTYSLACDVKNGNDLCSTIKQLRSTGSIVNDTEGSWIYRGNYVTIPEWGVYGPAKLLRLAYVSNSSSGSVDDRITFTDYFSGATYDSQSTAIEGSAQISIEGYMYTVYYNGASTNSDAIRVWLDYPQTTGTQKARTYCN